MRIIARALTAFASAAFAFNAFAAITNPQPVSQLLDRIGGSGTADRFVTVVDESLAGNGSETFVITSTDGKPCIKGSTLSALTTGIGWYLNHYANVNLSWNNLTTDLSAKSLPLPGADETHSTSTKYRYYMNFCTFSYSASTWTWERWQQEIDWMALRGINMPLQIVGVEEVWRQFLMEDYGYTKEQANAFVAGPCFMAWFGMNNLMGWGGPNPDWWYERQAQLGRKMTERMKSLGMEPVLPGYAGSVPDNFQSKTGIATVAQGGWCGFTRPHLIDPNNEKFAEVSKKYYDRVASVMGTSKYYAIDPFHEGANTAGIDVPAAYTSLYNAMNTAAHDAQWVVQAWQWSGAQRNVLDRVPVGKLIVLDLYSDGRPGWGNYKEHDVVYSTIFNFGARTGIFGRFNGIIDGFFNARNNAHVKGIGAAPEGIEQTPVMYDLLFELPWHASKPDAAQWMKNYALRRYDGVESPKAESAWELLRNSALNCKTDLQGPNEGIICARPALTVNKVSTWGGAEIFYDSKAVSNAAYNLIDADLAGENYSYDIADISRQSLINYSQSLLAGIKEAHEAGNSELFAKRRDAFLQLILDIDELLCTNPSLTLGNWTETARAIADEVAGATDADRNWLELDNARTLITTWGPSGPAGGLRDYSYRAWGGMLKDFYYQRWKIWFDNGMRAPSEGWFQWEWNWAHSNPGKYKAEGVGETRATAVRLMPKYLSRFRSADAGQEPAVVDRLLVNDLKGKFRDRVNRGQAYTPDIDLAGAQIAEIAIDFSRNTRFEESETVAGNSFVIPADAEVGERLARLTLADGTVVTYTVAVVEEITEPRTVSVATSNAAQGSVSIDGTDALSVTNTDYVVVRAASKNEYDFDHWTDAEGNNLGNDNPFTYYGKNPVALTAHFVVNKWGVPDCSSYERGAVVSNNQYLKSLSVIQGGEEAVLYSTEQAPQQGYVSVPTRIKAAPGGSFTLDWKGAGGLGNAMFLTVYADLNADGEFDIDSDELIESRGLYLGSSAEVGAGNLNVLLPYDMPKGVTHLRIRLDSSWNKAAYNSAHNAMAPKASTNRLVYEVLVEVVDSPDYPCTVTYAPSHKAFGTMRSENETMIYNPGETVIITAFPADGCHVHRWLDNHGRELPSEWVAENGNSVTFKTFDDAHIICELAASPVEANGWTIEWLPANDGGKMLTEAIERGEPVVDLSAENITNIAPAVFAGSEIKEITLPATRLMGEGDQIARKSVDGNGSHSITQLGTTISGTTPWVFTISGTTGSNSYNDYGSAIYGNGTNALADDYTRGWSQYYLTKAGYLQIKWDAASSTVFDQVCLLGDFKIESEFDGNKTLVVTVTNSNGLTQTKTLTNSSTMQAISQFAHALPSGMNLEYAFRKPDTDQKITNLFDGCHSLVNIHVPAANPALSEVDGAVYNKAGTKLLLYPEGRLHLPVYVNKSGSGKLTANPVDNGGTVGSAQATANGGESCPSLWRLEGDDKLMHINSGMALDLNGQSISNSGAAFAHSMAYSGKKPLLALKSGSTTHSFEFIVVEAIAVTSASGCAVLTFPVDVVAPYGVDVVTISGVTNETGLVTETVAGGDVIPAGTAVLVRGITEPAAFAVSTSEPAVFAANAASILRGTCVELADAGDCYVLSGNNFVRSSNTRVPANSAYILATDVPDAIGNSFPVDFAGSESSLINDIGVSTGSGVTFDLLGRPVTDKNPRPGIYIVNGKAIRK